MLCHAMSWSASSSSRRPQTVVPDLTRYRRRHTAGIVPAWAPDLRFAPSGVTRRRQHPVRGDRGRAGPCAPNCRPGLRAGTQKRPCRPAGTTPVGASAFAGRRLGDAPAHVMKCHVLFSSARPVAASGPCFARVSPARGRMAAPARFAHLIAPAREANAGHSSPSCFYGFFFRTGAKRGGKPAPWMPAPSSSLILSRISGCQDDRRIIS